MTGVPIPPAGNPPPALTWWVLLLKEVGFPAFMAIVLLYCVVVRFPAALQEATDKLHTRISVLEAEVRTLTLELRKR